MSIIAGELKANICEKATEFCKQNVTGKSSNSDKQKTFSRLPGAMEILQVRSAAGSIGYHGWIDWANEEVVLAVMRQYHTKGIKL